MDFPGGIEADEAPAAAACRERRDHVSIFELRLNDEPQIHIDKRDIVDDDFMAPEAVLAARISPFLRAYLEGAAMR